MTPGRPPVPTNLRILRGNPQKRPLPNYEPKPTVPELPLDPPVWLTGYAALEWRRVAPELHQLGLLTIVDVSVLCAYCQAYKRWRQAEEAIARIADRDNVHHGLMVKKKSGDAATNPLVRTAERASDAMVKYAAEFGFSPIARARIGACTVGPPEGGGGVFDRLLA